MTERVHFTKGDMTAVLVTDGVKYILYLPDDHRSYESYGRAAGYLEANGWSVNPEIF